MLRTLFVGSTMFLLVTSVAIGGSAHKGPKVTAPLKGLTGEEPIREPVIIGSYPSTYRLGPGDSIGFSVYDNGTNRSPCHNLINYGDGTFALGRMAAQVDQAVDRGTYYSFSSDGGTTWSPLSWVEGTRQGWGNIDQFVDAGGVEVTVSHTGLAVGVDAAKGAGAWSLSSTGSIDGTWALPPIRIQ